MECVYCIRPVQPVFAKPAGPSYNSVRPNEPVGTDAPPVMDRWLAGLCASAVWKIVSRSETETKILFMANAGNPFYREPDGKISGFFEWEPTMRLKKRKKGARIGKGGPFC